MLDVYRLIVIDTPEDDKIIQNVTGKNSDSFLGEIKVIFNTKIGNSWRDLADILVSYQ